MKTEQFGPNGGSDYMCIKYKESKTFLRGENMFEEYVGMSFSDAVEKAKKACLRTRVVYKDGEHLFVTEDYQTHRINFYVEKDKITKAYKG